jgi:hypothetical protein
VLVLNWSIHALPEPLAPAPVAADDAPPASAASARAVDEAFMDLMSTGPAQHRAAGRAPAHFHDTARLADAQRARDQR